MKVHIVFCRVSLADSRRHSMMPQWSDSGFYYLICALLQAGGKVLAIALRVSRKILTGHPGTVRARPC